MITDAELIFWCVCGVLALIAALAFPLFCNYLDYKDNERMFEK